MIKRDPSRFLLVGFLALLFLCALQVGWWILDNLSYTREIQSEIAALASSEVPLQQSLVAIDELSEGRSSRYLWEGSFFIIVLLAGMAVLTRTLRHDTELRRRQQNFLAAVSHEFKSPLASMQLAAETLILRSSDPEGKRLGQRILADCERLLRMVDNLLDTARIEEGRHRIEPATTNLAAAVASCVEPFRERASRHDIEIVQDVPAAATLSVDATAFDTMLRNLIDNAVKSCIAGNGQRIEVAVTTSGDEIRISVSDDGLGFPPEEARLMFEKFHRLGDELRRKTPGTGLGLYIVRRLAELSGAEIEARSEGTGRGATMTLVWPGSGA